MADPANCIRGGSNFEIFSVRVGGKSESSCSQLSESGIYFPIRGAVRRVRPFIDPPLSSGWAFMI